ncbi:MAG TPA: cytochrome c oxidase subunit 3, partial [Acidocella sp.]|nr:cytochrome c oxidase subunit 3 [Acidocella sp.]
MSATGHTATDQIKATVPHPYHMVEPSLLPLFGAASALLTFTGIIFAAHFHNFIFLGIGLLSTGCTMFLWWRD